MKHNIIVFALLVSVSFDKANAQCDAVADNCKKHNTIEFVSDGHHYRALLSDDQTAEFKNTFYGGSKYRISACGGEGEGNLIFSVYDEEKNLLFTNRDYNLAPYWDFEFASTMECSVETQLNSDKLMSGCSVVLINFKQ